MDRSGIPPTPRYSHPPPLLASRPDIGGQHSRSVSQPVFFFADSLPPLRSTPQRKSSPTSSISDTVEMSAGPTWTAARDMLQPRKLHRRSCSDISLGFLSTTPAMMPGSKIDGVGPERKSNRNVSDDFLDAFLVLDGNGAVESSSHRHEEVDSRGSGTSKNGAYSSESEAESSATDFAAGGESAPPATPLRHSRGISVHGLMEGLNFGEELPRIPPSPGSKRSQSCQSEFMDGEYNLEIGNGEFSGSELKKIMADKSLKEVALEDPKRAKRILANRQSAARSKDRKMRYISELERRVQILHTEATSLLGQLTLFKRDSCGLAAQNNELKIRLQALGQQAQLRDALTETLTAEVQRLKLATTKLDDSSNKQIKLGSMLNS